MTEAEHAPGKKRDAHHLPEHSVGFAPPRILSPSGGLALVPLRSAGLKDNLLMPSTPTGRRRCRSTTADRLVRRFRHNEATLLRPNINKSRLVMRRRLRDMGCGHLGNLPARDCFKYQRPPRLRDARPSGVISRPVAVCQSSGRARPDYISRGGKR